MTAFERHSIPRRCALRLALLLLLALAGNLAMAQAAASTDSDTASSSAGPIRLRQPATGDREGSTEREATQRDGRIQSAGPGTEPARQSVDPIRPWLENKPPEMESFAKLRRFGVDMISTLSAGAADFTPIVPPDYVVQNGDELMVSFWGSVDADLRLIVDRSGRITIPRVGPVMVAGLRLADLPQAVSRRASQVFKNFELGVSLGRLRGVRVYVTGFVQRPGAYVLSSLSTAMNAVMRAGGPADSGSFRVIELRRADKVIARLDLYDLLVRGDRSGDKIIQPDDVIHVAAIGPEVAMRGSVNRQAIYEFKPGETLADALRMAGGLNSVADRSRVAIERLSERYTHKIVELKLPANEKEPLGNGDVVWAFSAVETSPSVQRQNKHVRVEGEVERPGEFVMPPEATISDAIRAAGGLTSAAFLYGAQFTRESVRLTQQENYDRALRDLETEMVRATATARIATAEEVAASSATTSANRRLLEQLRALKPSGRIAFHLQPNSRELPNLVLEDGDKLLVPPRPNTVGVFGSVFSTGSYLYSNGLSVGDYLRLAGGPTRGADQSSIFMVRASGTVESSLQRGGDGLFARGLQIADLAVEPGDTIFVPEELNKVSSTTFAKDWTQIFYNLGLGFAGLKAALGL